VIDVKQAISSLKLLVDQLDLREDEIHRDELIIESKQKQLTLDREDLTARESAFLKKVDGHGEEVERAEKMMRLAKSIKSQSDDDREEMVLERKRLDDREKEILDLEAKEKQLEAREKLIDVRESDIEEREIMVEKDKEHTRDKQNDLEIRAKTLKNKQKKLQAQIDANRL
jgi:hypothetical protein